MRRKRYGAMVVAGSLMVVTHAALLAVAGSPAQGAGAATVARRVEVMARRTETSQVFANPDGSFTLEEHLRPQWVRGPGGAWVDADPTLRRNADGTISPVATTVAMTFSGGGDAPMARLAAPAGRSLELSWPATLPAPVLDANVATYPEIMPGVDLRIVADVDRLTHIFVIKNRQAAANARRLTVNTSMTGLTLKPGEAGSLDAVDAKGERVFTGLSPLMWDSAGKASQMLVDPRQAAVGMQLQSGRLTLTPDPGMLDDPKAVYPLYVDPEWSSVTGAKSHWTVLRNSNPSTSYYDRTSIADSDTNYGMMRAGFNDFEGPTYRDRSIWQMNISAVRYTHISDARFVLTQAWSGAGCGTTGKWTDLRHMNTTFTSSTTWNTSWNSGGSGWGATLSSSSAIRRYGNSCGPQHVEFPVTGQVAADAAVGSNYLWVGLRARSETDKYSWKRFKNDAFVSIKFNRFPNVPAPISTDGKPCVTGQDRPWVTRDTPVLAARNSDADTGQTPLTTWFYWYPASGSLIDDADHRVSFAASNGANATPSIPAGKLVDGASYAWQARTNDGIDWGQLSGKCEFNVDTSPPGDPGGVTAGFYNNSAPSGGPGIADTFTFNPPAVRPNEVTGYAYTLDLATPAQSAIQVDTVDPATFTATVTIAPPQAGSNTVRVWTKDRAGRPSNGYKDFTFQVKVGGLTAQWTFDGSPPTADVSSSHSYPLTLSATGATVVSGRSDSPAAPNKALSLSGGGYAETSGGLAARTDFSFTVSAWVKITAAGTTDQAAVAINDTNTAAFMLGYGGENRWVFRMAETNIAVPQLRSAVSSAAPTLNKWTHLAGTYDATTKTLRLFVGGALQPTTATLTAGFNATKKLSLGYQQWNGVARGKPLTGTIDDARLYTTLVANNDIQRLAIPLKPIATVLTPSPITFGTQVQVKFDSAGDTNVTAFRYSLDALGLGSPDPASNAALTHNFGVVDIGSHTIRVRALDSNGLLSDLVMLTVNVDPPAAASVSGVVRDAAGNPLAGAAVTLDPAGLTATSAADGSYSIGGFAAGDYTVSAVYGNHCAVTGNTDVTIGGPTVLGLTLTSEVKDEFGYSCGDGTATFTDGTTLLPLSGDEAIMQVNLPFSVPFYGQTLNSVWVDVNGVILASNQARAHADAAAAMPNREAPNNLIAPYWADLEIDAGSGIYTATTGSVPNRRFVIEWRNVFAHGNPGQRFGFEAVLAESGAITFAYKTSGIGAGAVVGIENQYGSAGVTYSSDEVSLNAGSGVTFAYPANPAPLPSAAISGGVTAGGVASAGVLVTIDPLGLSTTTNSSGGYRFDGLPDGTYHVTAQLCTEAAQADVTIAGGSAVQNFALAQAGDAFGYTCTVESRQWIPADQTVLALSGDDETLQVSLPFAMPFHGQSYSSVWVEIDGLVEFVDPGHTHGSNAPLPTADPVGFLAPFWDDFQIVDTGSVRTASLGTAPNRQFVIEWRGAAFFENLNHRISFEVILSENGSVTYNYSGLDDDVAKGSGAAVGIEGPDGTSYIAFSWQQPRLADGEAVTFAYPGSQPTGLASLSGAATVGGVNPAAPVTVLLNPGGLRTMTDSSGRYQFTGLLPGTYTTTAYACGRSASSAATPVITDLTVPTLAVAAATGVSGSYTCIESAGSFVAGDTLVGLSGDDEGTSIATPFPVRLFGVSTSTLWVDTNGAVYGAQPSSWSPEFVATFPNSAAPNSVVAPFWDDLVIDGQAGVYVRTIGAAPNRQFVIEWRNAVFFNTTDRVTFSVVFSENGAITYTYPSLTTARQQGSAALVGLENAGGTVGLTYSARVPVLSGGRSTTYVPVP